MGNDIHALGYEATYIKPLATIAKAEKDSDYGTDWGDYTVMEKPPWL